MNYSPAFLKCILLLTLFSQLLLPGEGGFSAGYNSGGGGFYIRNSDASFDFRMLGYIQSQATVFSKKAVPVRGTTIDFFNRRSRLDFLLTLSGDYSLFIELDAAPGSRTAMVESYINVKILKEQLQVRTGKFIVPFSTENLRSSRGYDVVERYLALNSMFLLPGLDTQYGLMVWGEFEETPLSYWAGVFNGNGSANTNVKENNVAKEITGKLQYSFTPQFKVSAAFDYTNENTQTLKLSDYTFTDYHAVSVRGDRLGYNADLYYEHGPWSFRTEGLIFDFPDSGYQLFGGFLQPAYFFYGNYQKGLQALIRLDIAGLKNSADNSVKRLSAYTLGFQWFFSPNLRLQADYHITSVNTPGSLSVYTNSGELLHSLLASLQLKF